MDHLKENRGDYKVYLPVKKGTWENKYGHLEISVEYTKGGHNYFSGNDNPRGYRVSVRPCDKTDGSISFTLMGDRKISGGFVMIEEAKRLSRKRLLQLAEIFDKRIWSIFNAVIRDEVECFRGLCKV